VTLKKFGDFFKKLAKLVKLHYKTKISQFFVGNENKPLALLKIMPMASTKVPCTTYFG